MLSYIVRRLIVAVFALFAVSALTFTLINTSVDPAIAIAGETASAADIALVREQYGLNEPLAKRYLTWVGDVLQGKLGVSYRQKRPVADILWERLPVTLKLAAAAIGFALLLSLPLGILSAIRPNSIFDQIALLIALAGQAVPSFWFSLMLILLFGVTLNWLPISGNTSALNYVMPAMALGYYASPAIMRLTRAGMMDVLNDNFIVTARAKGVPEWRIVLRHALPVAIQPVVSVASVQLGFMLGGSVVIESVFSMNGVGYLGWEAITTADIPILQAIVVGMAGIYILLTLLADVVNAWLDPRIRR